MPPSAVAQNRLENVVTCLTMTTNTLEIIADSMQTPFLGAIINTTQAVLENVQTVSKHKDDCVQLLEQIHQLLNAIVILHIKADADGELHIEVLDHVRKFTEYFSGSFITHHTLTMGVRILHKIYTFVEAQQKSNRVKSFFRQSEISTLFKDCQAGLNKALTSFRLKDPGLYQQLLQKDPQFSNSSNSISMLPSEPKIFHGRESEISDILHLFDTGTPRIAILGAGGMGKTSVARALLHQPEITARYSQNRFFVACTSATTKLELVNLIGAHLGLKPSKDLTQAVLQHFSQNLPSLLILDELEMLWEPTGSRGDIEELLSLLAGVEDLALLITMRGAERPAKVQWTRPFLRNLQPLDQQAARLTFADIADSGHNVKEVDQILSLTDNMPLPISLLAHLADTEGCSNVLSRWNKEKTSLVSEGFDKRSNLDLSISLSLSSPRMQLLPHSQELLSLLSMLPDGLADVDLIQSKLPLENILKCKTALKSTALAYSDEHKRLKVLMPIREYLQQHQPPRDHLIQSLLQYFEEMLKFHVDCHGTQSNSKTVAQIKFNFTNIQNVLQWGLRQKQPILSTSIYCVCYLSQFSFTNMQTLQTLLTKQIQDLLPQLNDHRLKAYFIIDVLNRWGSYPNSDFEALAFQALEHLGHFDDPDLKCKLYNSMAFYYRNFENDLVEAENMCKKSISLAIPTGNSKRHSNALDQLAWINLQLGKYSVAQMYAYESQKLARVSGDLYTEAEAVCTQALCWQILGHYKKSLSLAITVQSLLALCGMSGSEANLSIMAIQAEVHKLKSEYNEAWKIHTEILQITADGDAFQHAAAFLNVAEIEVLIGVPKHDVQQNIELARSLFTAIGHKSWIISCDSTLADLYLRECDLLGAKTLFEKSLKSAPEHSEIKSFCFEKLCNVSSWGADESIPGWTTIFLVHSLKLQAKLQVYKALQFFGQMFLMQNDEDTATSLFTVALEGFTYMDVHRSRAECMLRLGDISNSHGDPFKAVELWSTARPLFERSSQVKEVQCVDERLACIGSDVLEQHRKNIAHLVELNVPSSNLSPIEDEQQVELVEQPLQL
ncbi:hypothetical protein DFH08DRAFT_806856 [Mycena albidolilacea]|uniref:Novel STAND NTPase 1 domain-containing protein n=1 Tax=Mycena albidolilacea TaxID=1033008 RepID=A0AAD7A755_9AGAR|nr:hypothetical protein DFH08DRAFT_806856 [Mycena albidolilacea]